MLSHSSTPTHISLLHACHHASHSSMPLTPPCLSLPHASHSSMPLTRPCLHTSHSSICLHVIIHLHSYAFKAPKPPRHSHRLRVCVDWRNQVVVRATASFRVQVTASSRVQGLGLCVFLQALVRGCIVPRLECDGCWLMMVTALYVGIGIGQTL